MEALVDKGKIKLIGESFISVPDTGIYIQQHPSLILQKQHNDLWKLGVSNFSSPKLRRLFSTARIHPVVNQVELNPYFPQKRLFKFCQQQQIHVTAYGPLGCTPVPVLIGRPGPGPLRDPKIGRLAAKYSKTPAQVILCFMITRGASVIPKSNSPKRIQENFDCLFSLEAADYDIIDNLMGVDGERGVRNLETPDYLGFDNFNEEVEEP